MSESNKVLWNQPQNLNDAEQTQARENINAAKNAPASQSSDGLMSSEDKTKLDGIEAGAEKNVQSDWNQTNSNADDYIKNKPNNLVQDPGYVHTDNNFTDSDKNKLDGIEAGAEKNVQSDWNQSDNTKDDYIKNKPSNLVQDASYVHTDNNFTNSDKNKLDGIAAGAEVNVQSDWNQTDNTKDDFIKNKPSNLVQDASYVHTDNNFTNSDKNKLDGIEAGAEKNVQSNWNQTNTSADDYIKNKPSNLVQDASYVHTDNNFTNSDKNKLDGIEAGAEKNVQSDWNQTNSSADDYIKNKPSIPAPQVQSNWTATSGMGKILNKPTIGFKAYGAQAVTEATSLIVDGDEPNGIADIKVNGESKGILISGPYKTLLDSGILGALGDINSGIYIDANGEFKACSANPVFFKVTLTTTFAELEAALTANKIPLLVTASKVVPMCRYAAGTTAWFTDVTMWGNLLSIGAHSYVLTPNGWNEYPQYLNGNKDVHMPSCVTAKTNVAVQDPYDEWLRIGEFAIGGHGTSSGTIMIGIKRVLSGTVTCVTDSIFRTKNTNASGVVDNKFETSTISVPSSGWALLRMIDQYSGTATVDCTYDINIFETTSTNPSNYNLKIHKLFDGAYSKIYLSATETWGSMD